MNKAQFIEALANKGDMTKSEAKRNLNICLDIITECMQNNEEIVFSGFGTLLPWSQTARMARNPKSGIPVMIQPRTTVKFKAGKYLIQAINKK